MNPPPSSWCRRCLAACLLLLTLASVASKAANPPSPEQHAFLERVLQSAQKADRLLEQNDLPGAEQAAAEAQRLAGSTWEFLIDDQLARVYLRAGRYEDAAALFDFRPTMSLNAAIAFVKTRRIAQARKSYREVHILAYHKDFKPYMPGAANDRLLEAELFLGRGIVDLDQNRPRGAVWALSRAVLLIPENPLALWYYARALAAVGRAREARRFFKAAISHDHSLVAKGARADMEALPPDGPSVPKV